jgi:hypothetical protein
MLLGQQSYSIAQKSSDCIEIKNRLSAVGGIVSANGYYTTKLVPLQRPV